MTNMTCVGGEFRPSWDCRTGTLETRRRRSLVRNPSSCSSSPLPRCKPFLSCFSRCIHPPLKAAPITVKTSHRHLGTHTHTRLEFPLWVHLHARWLFPPQIAAAMVTAGGFEGGSAAVVPLMLAPSSGCSLTADWLPGASHPGQAGLQQDSCPGTSQCWIPALRGQLDPVGRRRCWDRCWCSAGHSSPGWLSTDTLRSGLFILEGRQLVPPETHLGPTQDPPAHPPSFHSSRVGSWGRGGSSLSRKPRLSPAS